DLNHFRNLNGAFSGSLAEIASFSAHPQDRNVMMAGMGAFGTAATSDGSNSWAQVLDGEGDANAIDSTNPENWYATSAAPVSINLCTQGTACDKAAFGSPVIGNAQVGNDGYGLTGIAPWILDPQNTANMIIGTCRVWRGPAANGSVWNANNAISQPLDNIDNAFCNGNAQIRSIAASGSPADASGAAENIYAGMAGTVDGGATVAGHIYSASVSGQTGVLPAWTDLTSSQVLNSPQTAFNTGGFDISSIDVDPHDSTGKTIYVTLQGFVAGGGSELYRSLDGGANWIAISANLPTAPANSIVVDPNNANTVYVALDTGVYVTQNINLCTDSSQNCWSAFGTGLPEAPVMQLQAFNSLSTSLLRAATYGRGIWEIPLLTSGVSTTMASLTPSALTFASQQVNTLSGAQPVTVKNTGTAMLTISSITISENFAEQDNCSQPVAPGASCSVQASFAPTMTGPLQGVLTVYANVAAGQLTATLAGTGLAAGNIVLLPGSLSFGSSLIGQSTPARNITISNTGGVNVSLQPPTASGDFQITANTCGVSLAPNTGCTVSVVFTPTAAGGRAGVFSITDDEGTQTVQLSGNGQAAATALLSGTSLNFSQPQIVGTRSAPQQITLTNNGDVSLTDIAISVSGDFTAQNNCGAYLIGHASCPISVVFVPSTVGLESGVLTVATVLGSQAVTLSGTGEAPLSGISALPAALNFGSQGLNTTSSAQEIVLTNSSSSSLSGLTFAVNGNFAISGGSCAQGETLNAQSSCNLMLTFTPAQTGALNGSLSVSSANLSSPLGVSLAGTGEDFQLIVNGSSSAVIVPGQTATYTLQAIPVTGSEGMLTLGCAGAPQGAVCAINPGTLPLASGVTGFATVTVTTAASTSAVSGSRWKALGITVAALLPCAFFGIRKRRLLLRTWLACILAFVLLSPVACGVHATGGGSTAPPGPGGSSSVYTLTITASVPGLQKTVPLTLTVQ
ncbi:choice-of-anchor D domain-containing protein, partial [Acidobacterium sp. S8]|uniref:choice-of-anchor D domain-containing protein n=1 Tax=Acidobacterium sp. S8 TaxID=1641854 RepID=UPI001C202DFD